jgi:tetratricopeptide (TPR) repeat protein
MRAVLERPLRRFLRWLARRLTAQAWQHITEERWSYAMWAAWRAVMFAPDRVEAHRALSHALLGARRFGDARVAYGEWVLLAPGDERLAAFALQLEVQVGDLQLRRRHEAEAAYRRALAVRPDAVEAGRRLGQLLASRGRARYRQGDLPEAVSLLTEAVDHDHAQPLAHYYLARALAGLGHWEAGLAAVCRAIALDPENETFRTLQAQILEWVEPSGQGDPGRETLS